MIKYLDESQINKLKSVVGDEIFGKIKEIEKEITPEMIPKSRFDEVLAEKNTLKTEREELNTKFANFDELKTKNEEYDGIINNMRKDYENLKINTSIENSIIKMNGRNVKAISALIESDKIKINESGEIEGLQEQLDKIRTNNDYLFINNNDKINNNGTNFNNDNHHNNGDITAQDLVNLM